MATERAKLTFYETIKITRNVFLRKTKRRLIQLSGLPPLMVLQLLSDSAFVKVAGICTGLLMEEWKNK